MLLLAETGPELVRPLEVVTNLWRVKQDVAD
jgi:hypothetical protein